LGWNRNRAVRGMEWRMMPAAVSAGLVLGPDLTKKQGADWTPRVRVAATETRELVLVSGSGDRCDLSRRLHGGTVR